VSKCVSRLDLYEIAVNAKMAVLKVLSLVIDSTFIEDGERMGNKHRIK